MTLDDYMFKEIPEYEGFYLINKLGAVYSVKKNRTLVPFLHRKGYKQVTFFKNGKNLNPFIHRLLMLTFVGPSDLDVNHKDGNKLNNKLENLEYVTKAQNMAHAVRTGLIPKGQYTSRAKLKNKEVREIKKQLEKGVHHRTLAKKYGVCKTTITDINTGLKWRHI